MINVFDVASYILKKTGRITTMKLQKLCYYVQAWSLVRENEPIFQEDFEAWANGPVCRALYDCHKGQYLIENESCFRKQLTGTNVSKEQSETIDEVLSVYGKKDPQWLSALTHMETPWIQARVGIPDGANCENTISKEIMKEYYGAL